MVHINKNSMKFSPAAKAIFLATLSISEAFTPYAVSATRSSSQSRLAALSRRSSASSTSVAANILAGACPNLQYHGNSNKLHNLLTSLSLRGGSTMNSALHSTAATAAVEEEVTTPQEIFRTDYQPLSYKVSNVSMNFDIRDGKTVVESELTVVPNTLDGGKFVFLSSSYIFPAIIYAQFFFF